MHSQSIAKEILIIMWSWKKMIMQIDLLTIMIENKLNTCLFCLEVFYDVTLHLSGNSRATSNHLFFEVMAIHTMLKHLEQVVETVDANDEESEKIEEIRSKVTYFKEMAKRMLTKYAKYYSTPKKINPLVNYSSLILDTSFSVLRFLFVICFV